jgi:hypothetical protein
LHIHAEVIAEIDRQAFIVIQMKKLPGQLAKLRRRPARPDTVTFDVLEAAKTLRGGHVNHVLFDIIAM